MKKILFLVAFASAVLFTGSLFAQADKGGNGRSGKNKEYHKGTATNDSTLRSNTKKDGGGGVKNGRSKGKAKPPKETE